MTQPMKEQELNQQLSKLYDFVDEKDGYTDYLLNEIKQQLSMLYAKAERWERLKTRINNHLAMPPFDDDDITNEGLEKALHYMKVVESTQTETKTEQK